MVKRFSFYFLLAAVLLVSLYLYFADRSSADVSASQGSKGSPPKVLVKAAIKESTSSVFKSVATGWADKSAEVFPLVDEKVTRVLFKPQQKVKRGELLVQQDDRDEQLALRLAMVQLRNSKSLLDRYRLAVEQGAVPQTQVDSAQAEYEAAQVAVEQARLAVDRHQIRAPFDGVVGITDIDPGQRIGPGVLITGLDSREIIYVDFDVPEALIAGLEPKQLEQIQVKATTPALPGLVFDARVVALDSRLNAEKRSLRVRANIPNPDDTLRPGMSFAIEMKVQGEMRVAVPEIALQWDRDGSYVWLIRNGAAARENVRVADRRQGQVFIEGNVADAETIVIEGGLRLREGVKVEVVGDPLQ